MIDAAIPIWKFIFNKKTKNVELNVQNFNISTVVDILKLKNIKTDNDYIDEIISSTFIESPKILKFSNQKIKNNETYYFVKISTEGGIAGWSEFDEAFGSPGVGSIIRQLAPRVVGQPVMQHERIWSDLHCVTRPEIGRAHV